MTREELEQKRKKLNLQKKQLEEEEQQLKLDEYNQLLSDNKIKLDEMRKNKDAILLFVPNHDTDYCSDDQPHNSYMDYNHYNTPTCVRCMLISILQNDYVNEYEIDIEIKIREIQ